MDEKPHSQSNLQLKFRLREGLPLNYILEINAFERWLETNHLPGTAQLLWYKLFALFNRCGWAEWITVDNQRLMLLADIKSVNSLIRAREQLIQAGMLAYQRGKKGAPNRYRYLSIHAKFAPYSQGKAD